MAEAGRVVGGVGATVPQKDRAAYMSPRITGIKVDRSPIRDTEGQMTKEVSKAVLDEEARFARSFGQKYEIAAVIDDQGRLNPLGNPMVKGGRGVNRASEVKHGTPTAVYTRRDRIPENATYTHFHPWNEKAGSGMGSRIGVSLSGTDLRSALTINVANMRARTGNYVFNIQRPAGGWNTTPATAESAWTVAYNTHLMENRRVLNGMTPGTPEFMERLGRINAVTSHQATQDVAKRFGWKYTRRKV